MRSSPPVLASALALALVGCAQEVPYQANERIVRAIPRDVARAKVGELLARGATWYGKTYEVVEVGETGFKYRRTEVTGGVEECAREFAALSPRLFRHAGNSKVEVVLVPFEHRWQVGPADSVWFEKEEDARMFADALASLREDE